MFQFFLPWVGLAVGKLHISGVVECGLVCKSSLARLMFCRLICVVLFIGSLVLLLLCGVPCMDCSQIICQPVGGHLCCFHVGAITVKAAMNILYKIFVGMFSFYLFFAF